MPASKIDDIKTLFQSLPNLVFIGVMIFISLALHPGFLFLMAGGELTLLLLAQTASIQKMLRARDERSRLAELRRMEEQTLAGLPQTYTADFGALKQLCAEIEHRATEVEEESASGALMRGVVEKLSSFRLEYVRMLRAHFLLAHRNFKEIQSRLADDRARIENEIKVEQSEQVRDTLEQNLKILQQRDAKVKQLKELVRLIEARLQVVNSSLQLIKDEVDGMTDVRGISNVVDDLLVRLQVNEELRSFYDETLAGDSGEIGLPYDLPQVSPGVASDGESTRQGKTGVMN
jgi:hypothetical protein